MSKNSALQIINHLNNTIHVADVLERERGDEIYGYDKNISCIDHPDTKPSLRVYSELGRQSYCFSCGEVFTPYRVVQTLHGFSFPDIIKHFEENYNYVVPEDLTEDTSDISKNEEVAKIITYLKKWSTPTVLNLTSKSLYIDSKLGGVQQLSKLYDKIVSIKESDFI